MNFFVHLAVKAKVNKVGWRINIVQKKGLISKVRSADGFVSPEETNGIKWLCIIQAVQKFQNRCLKEPFLQIEQSKIDAIFLYPKQGIGDK